MDSTGSTPVLPLQPIDLTLLQLLYGSIGEGQRDEFAQCLLDHFQPENPIDPERQPEDPGPPQQYQSSPLLKENEDIENVKLVKAEKLKFQPADFDEAFVIPTMARILIPRYVNKKMH